MTEKIINIEPVDPLTFYGINNSNFNFIKQYFSKIQIIGRGSELKVMGEESEIIRFEEKFHMLLEHFSVHNTVNTSDLEKILSQSVNESNSLNENGDALLFGRIK